MTPAELPLAQNALTAYSIPLHLTLSIYGFNRITAYSPAMVVVPAAAAVAMERGSSTSQGDCG